MNDETRLEREYTQVLQLAGCDSKEALKQTREMIAQAKSEVIKRGMQNEPPNKGDYILMLESSNEEVRQAVQKLRSEGVTDDDIRSWWNLPAIERVLVELMDGYCRMGSFIALLRQGLSETDAVSRLWKIHPRFGDPASGTGSDRPLPIEFKRRVLEFTERSYGEPVRYKTQMENSTSFNSAFRAANGLAR